MKKIVAMLQPFDLKQTVYVYENGNKIKVVEIETAEVANTICTLAQEEKVEEINLGGAKQYSKGIGKKIQELRIVKTGLSQDEFAKKIGKNRAYLSRVESGKQNLTIKTLQQILKEFDLSITAFFNQLDEEE